MSLELTGSLLVQGDDSLAMARTVLVDMIEGFIKLCYSLDGKLIVHKLSTEAVVGSML